MLELKSVKKNYPDGKGGTATALDGVSARFPRGELTVILGPSGSGKSTLVRLINRMVEPDSGSVLVNGEDVRTLDAVTLRRGMGYVIQSVGLFPHMDVAGNIAVVPRLLGWDAQRIRNRVSELLDLVRLPQAFSHRKPHQLSGGEAQRVGVARALAADPPVLLMDEPFGALDALTREALQSEFLRIQRDLKKTVLFVTHDVAEAVRLADRILVMHQGRIAGTGTPAHLIDGFQGDYLQAFLGTRLGIELLARVPAVDRADFGFRTAGTGTGSPEVTEKDILDNSATMLDALSWMLARSTADAYIRKEDGSLGRLTFDAFRKSDSPDSGS
jgi:osmoprotectant transport system ATP-binding protein